MHLVIRALAIYVFLLVIMRVSGKRQFSQLTPFDFVLLLIVSEAISQGIYGGSDYSLTGSLILVTTLIGADILLSLLKQRFSRLDDVIESRPTPLMQDGRMIEHNMAEERLDEKDILDAGRRTFGLESLQEIRHAVLETDGSISIVPTARRSQTEHA